MLSKRAMRFSAVLATVVAGGVMMAGPAAAYNRTDATAPGCDARAEVSNYSARIVLTSYNGTSCWAYLQFFDKGISYGYYFNSNSQPYYGPWHSCTGENDVDAAVSNFGPNGPYTEGTSIPCGA